MPPLRNLLCPVMDAYPSFSEANPSTRLETRTKEPSPAPSGRGLKPPTASSMRQAPNPNGWHCQPGISNFGRVPALEELGWNPKSGELCLCRAKSEETLMEARSGTDVQIVQITQV